MPITPHTKDKRILVSIGKKICLQRKLQNVTQTELAKAIGVTRTVIYWIEKGRIDTRLFNIYKIAEFLEKDVLLFLPTKYYI